MKIKIEKARHEEEYPIFCSEKYLTTESSENGWVTGYFNDEKIAIIPFVIYKKMLFRLLRFTNQIHWININYKEKYEQNFLDQCVEKIKELNIDMVIQPQTNVVFDKFPNGSIYAPFATYYINLKNNEENLWKNLHSKHRNSIRNGKKRNIKILENSSKIDYVYEIINNTFKRSNMSFMSRNKFKKLIINLGNNIIIYSALSEEGQIQGCAVIVYSNYAGYYLHGGSINKPITGAMNYLQWQIMLSLKNKGVKLYDFVGARIETEKGSKLEGIQKFKQRFGTKLYKGYMWKYPVKKVKYQLYSYIYKLLKNKNGDIIDVERKKLKRKGYI